LRLWVEIDDTGMRVTDLSDALGGALSEEPLALVEGSGPWVVVELNSNFVIIMALTDNHALIWELGDEEPGHLYRLRDVPPELQGDWSALEWPMVSGEEEIVLTFTANTTGVDGETGRAGLVGEPVFPYRVAMFSDRRSNILTFTPVGDALLMSADGETRGMLYRTGARPAWLTDYIGSETIAEGARIQQAASEASMNVRRLFDSSVSYYDSDYTTPAGELLPPQFPQSVPRTPAEVPCGEPHVSDWQTWTTPTWEALNFAVSDPHYFSYQYDSSGTGTGSSFTASAFGDLDCDGVLSTYVRVGRVGEGNEVRGGAGLLVENEGE
jgi:hypothetical protein